MSYIANYTNSYDIRGHEIEVTAPARFDDQTHQVIPEEMEIKSTKTSPHFRLESFNNCPL